jgi:RNA polymerase sigma factor (sigma-70 family)
MSTKDVDMTSSERDGFGGADSVLWSSLRSGSREAFEVIFNRFSNAMFNYGTHLFSDRDLVEDSIQDVFVEIWKRREYLSPTDDIKYYLFKSLKHRALRKLKTESKYEKQSSKADVDSRAEDSIETQMISAQSSADMLHMLRQAVERLPLRQREIIEKRFFQNLSANEISASMNLSIDSTYTLLSRAVRELRKSIDSMAKP